MSTVHIGGRDMRAAYRHIVHQDLGQVGGEGGFWEATIEDVLVWGNDLVSEFEGKLHPTTGNSVPVTVRQLLPKWESMIFGHALPLGLPVVGGRCPPPHLAEPDWGPTAKRLPFENVPTPVPLDEWMKRLADGDRTAFRPVFDQLWSPILRLCTHLLKHEADGADAAQQAMTKVLERASDYDASRPALPWAMAIAGWECRTILRRRSRRRETGEEMAPETHADEPENDFATRELARAAMEVLGGLSPADRETLQATFWDEACAVQGATLRKRRERALTRLRTAFRRLYGIG